MSDRTHAATAPEGEYFEPARFAGLSFVLALVAAAGLGLSLIGAFVWPLQFGYSWLFGFAFCFTLVAGCFFWILVHHATDSEWSVTIRRQEENIAALMPLLALFFIPVLIFRRHIYRWMTIPRGAEPALDEKHLYLNWHFFLVRAIIYFAFFIGAALLLKRLSTRQDKDGNPAFTLRMRTLTFCSLPLFALSFTFGAFDWLMSLNYHWFSTMWGVYVFAGAAGSSMSLLVLVITALRKAGYLRDTVTMEHYHIMGKFMLTFSVFWAYIGFSQYMLIWYANMPEETQYFITRNTESWNLLSILLVAGRFFVPFPLLLLRSVKKEPRQLCRIAGWILVMQALDLYLIILPNLHPAGVRPHILDIFPLVGIAATLAFFYLRTLGRNSLFPMRDPRLIESLKLTN